MARFIQCVAHGDQSHATSTSVDTLALSVRASNLLKSSGITTIEQLVQKTEKELLQQPNYGRKTVDEIKEELAKLGKKLAGS
jgi:DNA-directed RNA polymerase subunit alpha